MTKKLSKDVKAARAMRRKHKSLYNSKIKMSEKVITNFLNRRGITEEVADEFFTKLDNMLADIHNGKITNKFLKAMYCAYNSKLL